MTASRPAGYVRQLRQKLGDPADAPAFILTEPGVGYRWLPEPEQEPGPEASGA